MFEIAELGSRLSKAEYKAQMPALRAELLETQRRLRAAPFPVVVLFSGVDAAGKGETVNLLNEWMDPRWIVTRAWGEPSDEERERPEFWRYWRGLPSRGRIGLLLGAWYSTPILDRVHRRIGRVRFDRRLARIVALERALADDGAVILKFWMHLDRESQRRRLKRLEQDRLQRWRVTRQQWRDWKLYDRFVETAERALGVTSTDHAPWVIVEGADERYRSIAVATRLRDAIQEGLTRAEGSPEGRSAPGAAPDPAGATLAAVAGRHNVLAELDMTQTLDKDPFERQLVRQQGRLNRLRRRAAERGVSAVVVFEGWDAAGKGGAIRRVTAALDARDYEVIPTAAPTDEEQAHHYLWRFWRHLGREGRLTIFDRSWYGRVLVERVEGLATSGEWRRAYGEINEFEDQLLSHGTLVVKFWLHITKAEQLRRFRDRERTPHKRWKITDDDWRNRRRWDDYERALTDMVEHTSTRRAHWTLVEGNDKYFARVKVLRTLAGCYAKALKR
jgi:polyphosphate:AMP phosphotransferase